MMKVFFFIATLLLLSTDLFSQNEKGIFRKDFYEDNFKITIENNEVDFFSGGISVTDLKKNKEVFTAKDFYTRYNWDTLIDLNNDGSKEFILDLGTGVNMYNYNMYLIFDLTRDEIEPLEIHNAELEANVDEIPKIVSYVRLSPAVMGAGYSFSLRYEDGKLVLETDPDESKVLKSLVPTGEDDLDLINQYEDGLDECAEDSQISIYYEAYITQQKIVGNEKKGWEFFDKYYKCKNKKEMKAGLKKIVNDNYSFMTNSNNYKLSSTNY
ncbi:MAG: hypothetical protein ABI462_13240 [Ignavibacteria bacterium]